MELKTEMSGGSRIYQNGRESGKRLDIEGRRIRRDMDDASYWGIVGGGEGGVERELAVCVSGKSIGEKNVN